MFRWYASWVRPRFWWVRPSDPDWMPLDALSHGVSILLSWPFLFAGYVRDKIAGNSPFGRFPEEMGKQVL